MHGDQKEDDDWYDDDEKDDDENCTRVEGRILINMANLFFPLLPVCMMMIWIMIADCNHCNIAVHNHCN